MPNKDGTGPQGKGSRTGRGMGNCKGVEEVRKGPGPCDQGLRKGLGRRFAYRNQ